MDKKTLLIILETRFNNNMNRHPNHNWEDVLSKLTDEKINILTTMEVSGGEVDVVDFTDNNDIITFADCSPESPKLRRSLCYDDEALKSRKKFPPKDSAINMASKMEVEILTGEEYKKLQSFGDFDSKTSSWILTPNKIRELGGALFCDKRYNKVFTYHNGADSYYSSRGFRAKFNI